jgi:hypothetical protein
MEVELETFAEEEEDQGCHTDIFGWTDGLLDDGCRGVRDLDAL